MISGPIDLDTAHQLNDLEVGDVVTIEDELWTRVDSDTWRCSPWGDEAPERDTYTVGPDELGVDDGSVAFEARHRPVFDMPASAYRSF